MTWRSLKSRRGNSVGWLLRTRCLPIIICVLTGFAGHGLAAAGWQKNTAAARVEELYNGFPVETDTEGHEGYNAAQKAVEQLKLDF
jgi:hypothetical protein